MIPKTCFKIIFSSIINSDSFLSNDTVDKEISNLKLNDFKEFMTLISKCHERQHMVHLMSLLWSIQHSSHCDTHHDFRQSNDCFLYE